MSWPLQANLDLLKSAFIFLFLMGQAYDNIYAVIQLNIWQF